ncbi:MAG: PD-(D/E)XK nuclease family protein [Oscillospiraceae bacterium]|nr:PD-(D/E)XK nuclease family protein [Oscillospiraceae bacterium]
MLYFVLGRSGAGKTTYINQLAKSFAESSDSDVTLLVPEQASFIAERSMIKLVGAQKADRIDVLSFSRLAENILSRSGRKSRAKIDDGGRAVMMSMALEAVSDRLSIYQKHSKSPAVVNELLRLSEEFKRCGVTSAILEKTAAEMENCLLKDKLRELSVILGAYDALVARSFEDDNDLLTRLYEVLPESGYFLNRVVLIDAFSGFTRQEYKIIRCMLSQAKVVYVTLCAESLEVDPDSGPFGYIYRTAQKLIETAKRANVPVASPLRLSGESKYNNFPPGFERYKSRAVAALERGLYDPAAGVFSEETRDITVCAAPDVFDECAYAAMEVKRLLREEGYRCREIAVIERVPGTYEPMLRSALKKCGVPVFEDRRQPIVTQPLMTLIRSATDIAASGFSCDRVMRFLKTGLTGIMEQDIADMENYALMWEIGGDAWLRDWESHPGGYGVDMTQEDMAELERLNVIRLAATEPLSAFRENLRHADGTGFAKAVFRLLQRIGAAENLKRFAIELEESGEPALALEQERVWEIAMDILDLIHETVGSQKLTPKRFCELLDMIISTRTLGAIPQGLDEIAIGSADRMITSGVRAVFVVGANDGVFPKDPVMRGILGDSDRKRLFDLGLELYDFGEYRVISERFLVYKSLCCASEKLYTTYASSGMDDSAMAPSEFVAQIRRMMPKCVDTNTSAVFESALPEGVKPAFELACVQRSKGNVLYRSVRRWFEEKGSLPGKFKILDRAAGDRSFHIDDGQISRELFGTDMYLSASRVERYYRCPFAYFCDYGLLAKPRKKAEFDPAQQGTEIHFVLETMLREHGRDGLLAMTAAERFAEISRLLNWYLEEKLAGKEKSQRFAYLHERLAKTLAEVLERLVAEFGASSFVPVDLELKIDYDGDLRPYEVRGPDGGTVRIRGEIDRVDRLEIDGKSYVRVMDYKSGGKSFALSDVLGGLNMQMLLYLFAIWQNGGERYGEVVPSGILYVPAQAGFEEVGRDAGENTVLREKLKGAKMSGVVLKNDTVILGMEEGGAGVFVPASINSKGELKGNLVTHEQLSRLKEIADGLLTEMVGALHAGRIGAEPVGGKGHEHTCDYCDYKSVCGHEDESPVREIMPLEHKDVLALLDEDEENAGQQM